MTNGDTNQGVGGKGKVGDSTEECPLKKKKEEEKGKIVANVFDTKKRKPVADVSITLDDGQSGKTDKKGIKQFDGLEVGRQYEATAELPDKLKKEYGLVPDSKATATATTSGGLVVFSLQKFPALKVKVVDATKSSRVFKDATVSVTGDQNHPDTKTNKKGIADFGLTKPGNYEAKIALSPDDKKEYVEPDPRNFAVAPGSDMILTVLVEKINVAIPKIEMEYKTVLLEPNLHQHQDPAEDKIYADATRVEVWVEQSNKKYPYAKIAKFKCSPANVEAYTDEKCQNKLPGNLGAGIDLENDKVTAAGRYKLYLKGVTAGKFSASLELVDPQNAKVRIEKPASEEMGVVKLALTLHENDVPAIQGIQVDPDAGTVKEYWDNLEKEKLPDQKALTDQQKVAQGRLLHEQKDKNFDRAKLVLEKLDSSQWPGGTDGYFVILEQKSDSGGLELFEKQEGGKAKKLPLKIKVSDLKSKAKTFWVQGKSATNKFRDVRLYAGMDRDKGGLAKKPKQNGDWCRFTVAKIQEVKVDYTAPVGGASAWNEAEGRFYINFDNDPDGRKVTLKATLSAKLENVTVYFMLAPDKDNRKSKNWGEDIIKEGQGGAKLEWKNVDAAVKRTDKADRKDLLHLSATTNADGVAEKELVLSRFGGDIFHPGCYLEQDPHLGKYAHGHSKLKKREPVFAAKTIQVWRKFWYQRVVVQGMAARDMAEAENKWERVRAEMELCPDLAVTQVEVNAISPQAVYPRYMIEVKGGNADALVVADTNKADFFNNFAAEADKPIKVPILICDAQWDYGGASAAVNQRVRSDKFPVKLTMDKLVLNPPLRAATDLLVSGDWECVDKNGNPLVPAVSGALSNADLSVSSDRKYLYDVTVTLPAGAGAAGKAKYIELTNLVVRGADGPYLGEYDSATERILCVYDPKEKKDFQNTVAHELGHAFHQVSQAQPAGIPAHPNQYNKDGSHCDYKTNKCMMYESGPIKGSLNRFCKICHTYVVVQDMSNLA